MHSLGWKAFQDLCTTVLGVVFGQTIQTFFDSHDGGRDGAFHGIWQPKKNESYSGSFTVQCKFTAKQDKQLTLGDLTEEFAKAKRLAARGLACNYILMTNARITGTTDERLRQTFLNIPGIENFASFGADRISQMIRDSSRLRMLVPRVYGLGDLSQILDGRAYDQATEILSSLGDDLAKFVITDAHRKSAKALVNHGFVLLLGEAAAGKSMIAATLAVGAIDEWKCHTLKVRDANEFVRHSNPHESKQFFWIDDAFGPTQFDVSMAIAWNGVFPHMQAAIRRGAKVVFTSRDYIFRSAQNFLKDSAFPLLRDSQVVIQVEQLSEGERNQILYNHLKLGRQPKKFRTGVKPFLAATAREPLFKPEIARRLGDPFFTKNLSLTEGELQRFVKNSPEHLIDVIRTIDAGSRAALAAVFMRGGNLPSPMDLTAEETNAVQLIGGSASTVRESLGALNESLVIHVVQDGRRFWKFKHPTVRDAFAAIVAGDMELLDIYLAGVPVGRLLDEVSCGKSGIRGVKVIVPQDRFDTVLTRLKSFDSKDKTARSQLHRFLTYRCDDAFLNQFIQSNPTFADSLRVCSYLDSNTDVDVASRLHNADLLPEENRKNIVSTLQRLALETPDSAVLDYSALFITDEFTALGDAIRSELLPNLDITIQSWRDNWESSDDPDEYFQTLVDSLQGFRSAFDGEADATRHIDHALSEIEDIVNELRGEFQQRDNDFYDESSPSDRATGERSVFDDIDE